MALEAGRRLGAFEILQPLGAGGMGEVYRAKDTRLDRTVALKVLLSELSEHPHLRERLEREARAVSGLTHPHICTLHDVGRDEGVDYLVMEYLDGETLAERLQKGPLPLEQALRYAIEIAEALDAAHRQGVVHRDLKPGNVMLTKSGAKLLDFGLAKLREGDPSDPATSASALPTEHRPLTEMGTILGTYPYMAPEQLEGKDVDGRADLFAFGAVLHEMVTGQRAFDGESRASLIAAIMEREPPSVSTLQPLSPPGLDHVVKTCLAKDPDERWQSARDLASALRWIKEAGSQAGTPAPVARRRKTRERLAWALSAVLLLSLGAGGQWAWRNVTEEPGAVVRTSILPPEGSAGFNPRAGAMVLSPDGAHVAFVARAEGDTRRLWVRSLSALTSQPLAGTEGARYPFWSPDSRSLGFFSRGKLRTVTASGAPPQPLCDARSGRGGTWGLDGTILFTPGGGDVLYQVPASGGTPRPVTAFDESRGETSHRFPQFLPDGTHFLFLVVNDEDGQRSSAVFAASLESAEKKLIVETPSYARYDTSGHLLFLRGRTLVARRFDPGTLELSGEAVPVAQNVNIDLLSEATFSVSDTGLLLFQEGTASGEDSLLVWRDRGGRELGVVGGPDGYREPELSHDQRRIAVSVFDPETNSFDIWVLDVERGTSTRLTLDPAFDTSPVWSPDDRTIYFWSTRSGNGDIYSKASSGIGTAELVYSGEGSVDLSSLSPDGATGWLTSRGATGTGADIYRIDLESRQAEAVVQTPLSEVNPDISPDGRWLLYESIESGRGQVYVQSLLDEGERWPISIEGGLNPRWTRDGREIVFRAFDRGALMAAEVTFEPSFSVGIPEVLFEFDPGDVGGNRPYDVTPDGNRFLVAERAEAPGESLTLVQNWTHLLER